MSTVTMFGVTSLLFCCFKIGHGKRESFQESTSVSKSSFLRYYSGSSTDHLYTTDADSEYLSAYSYESSVGQLFDEQVPGTTAVYRYYSSSATDHFYTTDPDSESLDAYTYENIPGYIATSSSSVSLDLCDELQPLYRYYSSSALDHLYTIDPDSEYLSTFSYEGITGYTCVETSSSYSSKNKKHLTKNKQNKNKIINGYGVVNQIKKEEEEEKKNDKTSNSDVTVDKSSFLRYYSGSSTDHLYTTDPDSEYLSAYSYESSVGQLFDEQVPGTTAVYRYYSSSATDHFYTTDPSSESLDAYTYENIPGYIATSSSSVSLDLCDELQPLYRYYSGSALDHLYTIDPDSEYLSTFSYEGITGYTCVETSSSSSSKASLSKNNNNDDKLFALSSYGSSKTNTTINITMNTGLWYIVSSITICGFIIGLISLIKYVLKQCGINLNTNKILKTVSNTNGYTKYHYQSI